MNRRSRTPATQLVGQRFGRLTVLSLLPVKAPKYRVYLLCRCDCGREKPVRRDGLRRVFSCGKSGCYRSEVSAAKRTTHGLSRHPLYGLWAEMIRRCENPKAHNYRLYGGRGIAVCERWHTFSHFLADVPERPSREYSLDRIDNNEGYRPGNVQWASAANQARNTRRTVAVVIGGETHSLNSAKTLLGLSSDRPIRQLMRQGKMTAQEAVDQLLAQRTRLAA